MLGDDEPVTVRLRVDAGHADRRARRARRRRDASTPDDRRRRVDVEVTVANRAAFRSFVLGFLDHAEVLGPPEVRADIVAWLERAPERTMSPRPLAGTEIQRILALVPWIVAHPGATKAEIAERFGVTVDQLDDDLELVLMSGVPPYTPGDYLDVEDDDDGA